MTRTPDRKKLGRGLSALLAETQIDVASDDAAPAPPPPGTQHVPIEAIRPNPAQPRRQFSDADLDELASSIARNGVIQPLIVRRDPGNAQGYQIVAGERRWRAAQRAQLHELPVIERSFTDEEVLEVAIIENIQRVDLNPIEEAAGYKQLMESFGHTQDQLAQALGKSRSHIANLIRLLKLPDEVIDMIRSKKLSAGHARALITVPNPIEIARKIIAQDLSVRQVEELVKKPQAGKAPRSRRPEKDADTRAIEGDLSAQLKCRVEIDHKHGQDGGQLKISYRSLDDLDRLLAILSGSP